ncbi:MAG: hypothetical protein ACKOX2_10380 [Microcystaceae cyanobacterium]
MLEQSSFSLTHFYVGRLLHSPHHHERSLPHNLSSSWPRNPAITEGAKPDVSDPRTIKTQAFSS